jgi:hypothetical protein
MSLLEGVEMTKEDLRINPLFEIIFYVFTTQCSPGLCPENQKY